MFALVNKREVRTSHLAVRDINIKEIEIKIKLNYETREIEIIRRHRERNIYETSAI